MITLWRIGLRGLSHRGFWPLNYRDGNTFNLPMEHVVVLWTNDGKVATIFHR